MTMITRLWHVISSVKRIRSWGWTIFFTSFPVIYSMSPIHLLVRLLFFFIDIYFLFLSRDPPVSHAQSLGDDYYIRFLRVTLFFFLLCICTQGPKDHVKNISDAHISIISLSLSLFKLCQDSHIFGS